MRLELRTLAFTSALLLPGCQRPAEPAAEAAEAADRSADAEPGAAKDEAAAPALAPGRDGAPTGGAATADEPARMAENASLHIAAHGSGLEVEAPGCVHEDHDPASCGHGTSAPPAGSTGHFGQPFALAGARPLAQALADFAEIDGQVVQVSGTVGKVCQKKGCWMVMEDGEARTRVLMEGHFGVPMDGQGKAAIVEGTLGKRTFTEAQVKHLAQDGGDDAGAVAGERAEYVLKATGVEFAPQS